MVVAEIESILNDAIGLTLTSIGTSTLDRAVHRRMRDLAVADQNRYLAWLKSSREELKLLIEEVVVPETWFFRDEKPFQAVQRIVLASRQKKTFRLLSAPCSTGEEPYSLVIALLQAGLPEANFQVMAMDISARAINKAKAATYGENSFRSSDLSFRASYFKKTATGYVLDPQVCRNVTFKQGNLLNQTFMEYLGKFDIIFCRNLLIYLDRQAQQRSVDTLAGLLAKDGLLFVGHAEAGIMRGVGFAAAANCASLAFQKITGQEGGAVKGLADPTVGRQPGASGIATLRPSAAVKNPPPEPARSSDPGGAAGHDLDRVRQLVDQGRLAEAADLCTGLLSSQDPSAAAYSLLGTIREAEGALEEAMSHFRRSVYLDPDNSEGLVRLASLAERLGDLKGAMSFRQRAERIRARGDGRPAPSLATGI